MKNEFVTSMLSNIKDILVPSASTIETSITLSIIGTITTILFGGWDSAIQLLFLLIVVDFFSGLLKAYKLRVIKSRIMYWGAIRKITELIVVVLAYRIDFTVGLNGILRLAVIYYYCSMEGLSVLENFKVIGTKVPTTLTDTLTDLATKFNTTKSDKKED